MGCVSAKQVTEPQVTGPQVTGPPAPDGEGERSKSHGNGELLSAQSASNRGGKPSNGVLDVNLPFPADQWGANGAQKYAGAQEAATDGYVTEKSALSGQSGRLDDTGSNQDGKILSVHSSESQREFFRMLDEKIEKGPDYYPEEEDAT
ncbi:uncharacterized protein LOC144202086 [Stigmatopora nigra]